jgi:hypothetical protein
MSLHAPLRASGIKATDGIAQIHRELCAGFLGIYADEHRKRRGYFLTTFLQAGSFSFQGTVD